MGSLALHILVFLSHGAFAKCLGRVLKIKTERSLGFSVRYFSMRSSRCICYIVKTLQENNRFKTWTATQEFTVHLDSAIEQKCPKSCLRRDLNRRPTGDTRIVLPGRRPKSVISEKSGGIERSHRNILNGAVKIENLWSDVFLEGSTLWRPKALPTVAHIFEVITSTPLHGTSGVHQVAMSSQEDFESCLADAAEWVHRNPL